MEGSGTVEGPTYRERLHVPLRWWVQGVMLVASLWLAMIVSIPEGWAWGLTALALLLLAALMLGYGAPRIEVANGWLRAGNARIEAAHLGTVQALDAEATRRTAGRDADVRAFLLLRPYAHRAVKVQITDPADPAPYWLICTRHPDPLAAAIEGLTHARS
jgi:hypothetical protein